MFYQPSKLLNISVSQGMLTQKSDYLYSIFSTHVLTWNEHKN
jgi:hypothetical protein